MKDVLVRKPTPSQKTLLELQPTWDHHAEVWPAEYDKRCETFLVIEGNGAIVVGAHRYVFSVGDLVTCRPGLKCVWKVDKYIKKHYIFDLKSADEE